jgi:phosphotransferase system enzyme I (PtsI)
MAYYMTHANVAGIVLSRGGTNSHTVILAKAFEIPTVINIDFDGASIFDDIEAIVDGTEGDVYIDPSLTIKKEFFNKKEQFEVYRSELKSVKNLPSITKDGKQFKIMANIEVPEEIDLALSYGAEGIGLFRTEFLYMFEKIPPALDEQTEIYSQVLSKMGDKPVVIRTLDIGGEKNLEAFDIGKEENPALGLRAIRYFLKEKDHFYTQIKAILRAAKKSKVKILFPMITEIEEIRELKEIVYSIAKKESVDRGNYDIGIMVETPAAALTIDSYVTEVDFVSIGTNDLIQYTLAVDRGNSNVNYLYKPLNPAVLRLLKFVADEGRKGGIDVQLCGEMASKPIHSIVLIGLGINSISMASQTIPIIKRILRSISISRTRQIMKDAVQLSSADEVNEFIVENLLRKCPSSLFKNILPVKI